MLKAITPSTRMPRVEAERNWPADICAPTPKPRKMVTMLRSAFWAVSESRLTTPHSRMRLPNMKKPIKGAADGISRAQSPKTTKGKMIFSSLPTCRICSIRMRRSDSVVSARMIGG